VGNCPEPECCKNRVVDSARNECTINDLPSIQFKGNNSIKLERRRYENIG